MQSDAGQLDVNRSDEVTWIIRLIEHCSGRLTKAALTTSG